MMTSQLKELLAFCRANGRICPVPMKWNELWELLPNRQRQGGGWHPSLPLILAAWWVATPSQKQERLEQHLVYAEENNMLDDVDKFLRGLNEKEWYHEGD